MYSERPLGLVVHYLLRLWSVGCFLGLELGLRIRLRIVLMCLYGPLPRVWYFYHRRLDPLDNAGYCRQNIQREVGLVVEALKGTWGTRCNWGPVAGPGISINTRTIRIVFTDVGAGTAVDGHVEPKARAGSGAGLHSHRPTHGLNNRLCDGEAQTRPLFFGGEYIVAQLREPLEQSRDLLRRNTRACIDNAHFQHKALRSSGVLMKRHIN
mmetsp:Transcript_22514/g.37762  ORF Transcript_22514/g.37762 Transcript_22514/m.37762 type:complete len:210 (+) Transcript_22514:174-803(+)